ncbi:MAG TPA: GNAT family N-acetyltransferase [Opitutaceae bacterium]|jgi:phosphinothricin acetyltransferase
MSAPDEVKLVRGGQEFAPAILDIFNDTLLTSTSLYDYRARTPEMMVTWFENKRRGNFPVIAAVNAAGSLLGFGSYGTFRAFPAYKYSVEHSVYVHKDHRGRGLGRTLLQAVIAAATEQEYHTLIGAIDASNAASVALHRSMGFLHCGTFRQTGYKFGRWLDVDFYQLLLETPARPTEDAP